MIASDTNEPIAITLFAPRRHSESWAERCGYTADDLSGAMRCWRCERYLLDKPTAWMCQRCVRQCEAEEVFAARVEREALRSGAVARLREHRRRPRSSPPPRPLPRARSSIDPG